jgi:hypothetical protein
MRCSFQSGLFFLILLAAAISAAAQETYQLQSTLSGGTMTVAQGQSQSMTLTVTSENGFISNGSTIEPLTYSCSNLPALAKCTFTPISPTSRTSITLLVATVAPSARNQSRTPRVFYAALLPGLLGIVLAFHSRRRSLHGIRMLSLIVLLGFSTVWLASCANSVSGNGGTNGTPVGSSLVTVNATTGGASPLVSSMTFTLTVTATGG